MLMKSPALFLSYYFCVGKCSNLGFQRIETTQRIWRTFLKKKLAFLFVLLISITAPLAAHQMNTSYTTITVQDRQVEVMFTFDLAKRLRGTGVTVHCVRVGNVAIPNERLTHLPIWIRKLYGVKRRFSMTPEKMAETYVWLATDPTAEQQTGGYWDAPGVEVKANKNAYNTETQRRLWAVSAMLTGVKRI